MPSQRNRPRLCIFGDSHISSVRRALDGGVLDLSEFDVEFWGATGPLFREFRIRKGKMAAKGEALAMAQKINGQGRSKLGADEFDVIVFYGARVRAADFLAPMLDWQHGKGGWMSRAALDAAAQFFLHETRAYRHAVAMAAERKARIVYVPTALPTMDVVDLTQRGLILDQFPKAVLGTAEDRARILGALSSVAARQGVTLLRQPEQTIVNGCCTDARYAAEMAVENADYSHKSAEYAAEILGPFMTGLSKRFSQAERAA